MTVTDTLPPDRIQAMHAVSPPPPDFAALRRQIEAAGADAMNPDVENRQARFECAISEVLDLRNKAMAIRFRQVRNPEARLKAIETSKRAERRVAQLLIAAERAGLRYMRASKGAKVDAPTTLITLSKVSVTRKQSQTWRPSAMMSDAKFETWLEAELLRKSQRRRRRANVHKAGQSSTTTMPIANIKIGQRHRRDLGDIAGLAASISGVGLLHPVVVKADGTLIAGERRLSAFKQLERTEIPVTVVDLDNIVRGELAENAIRKDFLPSEIEAIRRTLEPTEKEAATSRKLSGRSVPDGGETRDQIGALAGVSGRTVDKIAAVVAAAEAEPERFGHLVEEMDRTGKVDRAHKQVRNKGDGRRQTSPKPKQTSPAANDAPDDAAQTDKPALEPIRPNISNIELPAPESAAKEPMWSNNDAPAQHDLAPAKTDVAPTPAGEPAPPPDPWADRRALFRDSIGGLRELKDDFGPLIATMPSGEADEAKDVVFALSAALHAAIDRATPVEEPMSPAAWRRLAER